MGGELETWVIGSDEALQCIERLAPDPITQATPPAVRGARSILKASCPK